MLNEQSGKQSELRPEEYCPIPEAHKRLHHAHRLWHQTEDEYADPEGFCTNLNSSIQTLRSITFVLQKEKRAIPAFAVWYEQWREKLKEDRVMRWLVDARNRIEKEGDLKTYSTARVSILSGWDDPQPVSEFLVDPMVGPEAIAEHLGGVELPPEICKEGVLVVERRWVVRDLPELELLDVLAHCYGVLASLLTEAHRRCGFIMRTFRGDDHRSKPARTEHLGGRLPCMVGTAEMRTARFHLLDRRLMRPELIRVKVDSRKAKKAAARYKVERGALSIRPGEDILDAVGRLSDQAKRVLATDHHHVLWRSS